MNDNCQLSSTSCSFSNMSTASRFLCPSTSTSAAYERDLASPCGSEENNSPTALNSFNWDKPALEDKALDFGWTLQNRSHPLSPTDENDPRQKDRPWNSGYVDLDIDEADDRVSVTKATYSPRKQNEVLQKCGTCHTNMPKHMFSHESTNSSNNSCIRTEKLEADDAKLPLIRTSESYMMSPPTPTESREELLLKFRKEQESLKKVPWFQAGIPREIALEVLSGKPVGSFIVRESTTKPGCYALSLRVPPEKNASGIAHYLIMHTNKGYKIKGFIKEFSSLDSLITHHSLMPELLPCTLTLPRREKEYRSSRRDDDLDFVPSDQSEKCSVFSDIHWLMNDLEL